MTTTRRVLPAVALTLSMIMATACGGGQSSAPPSGFDVPETVALGELPEPLSGTSAPPAPPTTRSPTPSTTEPAQVPIVGPIADVVVGYRVLLIGDTVLASTAPRNDGIMCDVLADFGWTVEIAAERGRFIDFGQRVLDERLEAADGAPWDAAAVMLGNHFDGDLPRYTRHLEALLDRLSPRPTIVYTLSEVNDDAVAINEIIRDLPRSHPNAIIIDWAAETVLDPSRMFADDGPELSRAGGEILVLHTVARLGKTPLVETGEIGECLPTVFADDSAIVL